MLERNARARVGEEAVHHDIVEAVAVDVCEREATVIVDRDRRRRVGDEVPLRDPARPGDVDEETLRRRSLCFERSRRAGRRGLRSPRFARRCVRRSCGRTVDVSHRASTDERKDGESEDGAEGAASELQASPASTSFYGVQDVSVRRAQMRRCEAPAAKASQRRYEVHDLTEVEAIHELDLVGDRSPRGTSEERRRDPGSTDLLAMLVEVTR